MSTLARLQRRRAIATTSWLAIGVVLATSGTAFAQSVAAPDDAVSEVVVVGARASQQSAIDRKKRARTATDSIVADDVGSFPDRNLNEAISRVAGVALERDGYGDGTTIAVRGNSAEFTRVELDGMGVQNTGGFAMSADTGRGADMRELPSDLIKSVDVVKGTTADMTEGSLGGGVQITTRSALDFKKPYVSFRLGGSQNSLSDDIRPDVNLILSRKFFGDRLGVLFSTTYTENQLLSHNMQTVTSGNAGYFRLADFDQSPEKTFSFNPSTVRGSDADTLLANSTFSSRRIVELSAAATTKDDCLASFPLLPSTASNNQKNARTWEQQTCLNQWNDYSPSLIRSFLKHQETKNLATDIRFDYRFNDKFTVYAKFAIANRESEEEVSNRNLGGITLNPGNHYDAVNNPVGLWALNTSTYPNRRTILDLNNDGVSDTAYHLYDATYGLSAYQNNPVRGTMINVLPTTDPKKQVVVDSSHHLTQFTITDGAAGFNQNSDSLDVKSNYSQFGGTYDGARLRVDFLAGIATSEMSRVGRSLGWSMPYGEATLRVGQSGLWTYDLPTSYDESNTALYQQVIAQNNTVFAAGSNANPAGTVAYSSAQRPLASPNITLQWQPTMQETEELNLKFDVTYDLRDFSPLFTRLKTGMSFRNPSATAWDRPGGFEIQSARGTAYNGALTRQQNIANGYIPPVVMPTTNLRGVLRSCLPTSTSIESCNYGYVANTDPLTRMTGTFTMTPAEMANLISSNQRDPIAPFFGDYPDRGAAMDSWQGIDVRNIYATLSAGPTQAFNFDCMKSCTASDGNVYAQPFRAYDEKFTAAYYMMDFGHDLPFGMEFDGNFGLRVVHTQVSATGLMELHTDRITAFNAGNPGASTVARTSYRQNISFSAQSVDVLPSYNVNVWVIPDKLVTRFYTAKTVTRPRIGQLIPAGNCVLDERVDLGYLILPGDADQNCPGRIGNPDLKPFTASDHNISIEWYPNRDTTFSIAYHSLNAKIGYPLSVNKTGPLFSGVDLVDPLSGRAVSDLVFNYPTYDNGPGFQRTGLEFTSKTAFTFLPWLFRYTGADFNYSKLKNAAVATILDPITGDLQATPGESDYFANVSLWYDDGRVNARVSYQGRGASFICITSCGSNAVNNYAGYDRNVIPYNPGQAYFKDESKFVDAKISYKIRPDLEVYLEGRNVTKKAQTTSGGQYGTFADGVNNLYEISYSGRRLMAGLVYRYGAK